MVEHDTGERQWWSADAAPLDLDVLAALVAIEAVVDCDRTALAACLCGADQCCPGHDQVVDDRAITRP